MLSSVLKSERAVTVNIEAMRAFSRFREVLSAHKGLARQLDALESKDDRQFKVVFDAIRRLIRAQRARSKDTGPYGVVASKPVTAPRPSRRNCTSISGDSLRKNSVSDVASISNGTVAGLLA